MNQFDFQMSLKDAKRLTNNNIYNHLKRNVILFI